MVADVGSMALYVVNLFACFGICLVSVCLVFFLSLYSAVLI